MDNQLSVNSILEFSPKSIPIEISNVLAVNGLKSICFVETKSMKGFAGLYLFQGIERTHHCLLTCYHVLPPEQVHNTESTFKFEGSDTFNLRSEWVAQIHSNSKRAGDYIIIEFTQVGIDQLISKGAIFLKICSPKIGDQFVLLQCINGKLSFGYGVIQDIKGYYLEYYEPSKGSISGSPLILLNGEAIGMNRCGDDIGTHRHRANELFGSPKSAVNIQEIIREFLATNQYKFDTKLS